MSNRERTLYCGNLSEKVTEKLLYELFLQAGPLEKVTIPKDKDGRQRTYGFIEFTHTVSVQYAVALMNGIALYGRILRLDPRSGSSEENPYLKKLQEYLYNSQRGRPPVNFSPRDNRSSQRDSPHSQIGSRYPQDHSRHSSSDFRDSRDFRHSSSDFRSSPSDNRYARSDGRYSRSDSRYPQNESRYPQNESRYPKNESRFPQNDSRFPRQDRRLSESKYPDSRRNHLKSDAARSNSSGTYIDYPQNYHGAKFIQMPPPPVPSPKNQHYSSRSSYSSRRSSKHRY